VKGYVFQNELATSKADRWADPGGPPHFAVSSYTDSTDSVFTLQSPGCSKSGNAQ
jgi:hypothetical protein